MGVKKNTQENDKKRKTGRLAEVLIFAVILVVVMAVEYLILAGRERNGEQAADNVDHQKISLRYGDLIDEIPVWEADGQEITALPHEQEVTLIIYLSEACKTCVDLLAEYERLSGILGQENIRCLFLFSDRIPASIAKRYGVSMEQCYTVDSSVELALSTPTWIYVGSGGTVEMIHSDGGLVLEKILKSGYIPDGQLQDNTREYLMEHFADETDERPVLFYFSMKGCKDCAAADEMMEEQGLEERFQVVRIYTEQDLGENLSTDQYQLFRRVFNINWYPSFLLVRGEDAQMIVEQSLEALQERLLREADLSEDTQ